MGRMPSFVGLVSNRNAAAIGSTVASGLVIPCYRSCRSGSRLLKIGAEKFVAKNSKKFEIGVDTLDGPRLYTPHQRGRRAAGDEEVRF
ncbi:hypothetical protein MESS2_1520001 [Mesorhizobium metallidurans STM 2683]|uniref:Uncharacterized protein n=1 Tax=Mesorhizobium metallidurans STM 2683 TaxID=1297569 RepID=M5EKC2_9HYPH|nr:hypothetical protein MESS2_1520001 [Mesorhizobium metallidurans STM 2683]